MKRLLVGLAVVVLAGPWIMAGGVAHAAAPDEVAWWYKPYTSTVPVRPAPPNVPAGGLYVQQDASSVLPPVTLPPAVPPLLPAKVPNVAGPTAFSTVRLTTPRGSPATLTLKTAIGSTPIGVDIVACPTISPWQAPDRGSPGPYDQAPSFNCTSAVKPTTGGTSMTWQLPVTMQFVSGTYSIALVPNPANKGVFTVAFDPPGSSSVTAGPVVASSPAGAGEASAALPGGSDVLPADQTGLVPAGGPSIAASLTETAAPPAVAQPPGSILRLPSLHPLRPASHHGRDQHQRELAVAVLLVLMVAWWYVGGQAAPAPKLLGALVGRSPVVIDLVGPGASRLEGIGRVRGIGRFAKPRTGRPPRLR